MRPPLVIYHAGCIDGFTAAWAVRVACIRNNTDDPELVPAHYGDAPPAPADVAGRSVFVVDFSYPRDVLLELERAALSLLVLDHHKTAAAALEGLPFATFDVNRSGAGIAWDELVGGERPWLIDYVEDRDLWRFALPGSREVNASLRRFDFNVDVWEYLSSWTSPRDHEPMGRAILDDQEQVIRRHVGRARRAWLRGIAPVGRGAEAPLVVNATTLVSEIGNRLALAAPFAATWRELDDGGFVYSLRSAPENPDHVDVSRIAELFGGGGHRHAAGFRASGLVHSRRGDES